MPPRRRSASGYHGVRARPSRRFDAEIRSGDERIHLGTFDTAHEAARAYDAVAWHLRRFHRTMNFHDVWTQEQAEQLEPSSPPFAARIALHNGAPGEEHFLRPSTRHKMALLAGKLLPPRAVSVYCALQRRSVAVFKFNKGT
ncbi:ethylene-responsive transcription factor 1B-like [Lolium perenne]|uniref:ethylene-responsive transcription factor 1B-like n=1 Tax=Lolium perenne TaxID=4522 RepID=UPI0021F622C3|nr:ethylene-responsive transcription factor 1B-like [Lolium perenne]